MLVDDCPQIARVALRLCGLQCVLDVFVVLAVVRYLVSEHFGDAELAASAASCTDEDLASKERCFAQMLTFCSSQAPGSSAPDAARTASEKRCLALSAVLQVDALMLPSMFTHFLLAGRSLARQPTTRPACALSWCAPASGGR